MVIDEVVIFHTILRVHDIFLTDLFVWTALKMIKNSGVYL